MVDITELQNVVLDKGKLADRVRMTDRHYIGQVLGVGDSQVEKLRRSERSPSVDGLLRLMLFYGLKPEDLVKVEPELQP
jgi:transcriptional regulator with XRE-family HTH domain